MDSRHPSTLLLVALSFALPVLCMQNITKRDPFARPAISSNFPDPSIIWDDSQNEWVAFATNGHGRNVQVATSQDFVIWTSTNQDALPKVGAWVDSSNAAVWAPMVIQIPDKSFVMYYTAVSSQDTSTHCVGVATSTAILGPYTPKDDTFACHSDLGGALDPSGHYHPDGSLYIVYKINGNARGNGGSCNNGVKPIKSTPIMLQKVAADGFTKIGNESQILDRDDGDGPLIEGPSLIYVGGVWFLFFSSGCSVETTYDLSYATASTVTGPYTKARAPIAPLLVTGTSGLKSPGSACFTRDGSKMVFGAWLGDSISEGRGMWTGTPTISGTNVILTLSSSSSSPLPSPSPNRHRTPVGAIVGGVVGGVAIIAILVAFIVWQRRRKPLEGSDDQSTTPVVSQFPSSSPSYPTTEGTSGGSSTRGPLSSYGRGYVSGAVAQIGDTKGHGTTMSAGHPSVATAQSHPDVAIRNPNTPTIHDAEPPEYTASL